MGYIAHISSNNISHTSDQTSFMISNTKYLDNFVYLILIKRCFFSTYMYSYEKKIVYLKPLPTFVTQRTLGDYNITKLEYTQLFRPISFLLEYIFKDLSLFIRTLKINPLMLPQPTPPPPSQDCDFNKLRPAGV